MALDILIEEQNGSLWVAALEKGHLQGLEVDPSHEEVRWGSIYRGKVVSIDTSIDAVYLNLDGDNTGILYNRDVRILKDGKYVKGGERPIGQILKAGDVVTVQAKMAYLINDNNNMERKTPKVSMDITLPGRYIIYCPLMQENRISQRISNKDLRKNMRSMLNDLEEIEGCILRSAAANTQTDILLREGKILKTTWDKMQEHLQGQEVGLIMLGPDAIQRSLSDNADKIVDCVEVVVMDHYTLAEEWCSIFAPDLVTKIVPLELENASEDLALFDHRDIIGQIDDLFHNYAKLDGGGNIIIQETSALTAIDVNRGADKRSNLAVNIDAAKEIARQIRMRNAGGIIIIDFLKFQGKKGEGQLIAALEEAVLADPCTVQIHGMTNLGLIELTRKRRTPPLQDRIVDLDYIV